MWPSVRLCFTQSKTTKIVGITFEYLLSEVHKKRRQRKQNDFIKFSKDQQLCFRFEMKHRDNITCFKAVHINFIFKLYLEMPICMFTKYDYLRKRSAPAVNC